MKPTLQFTVASLLMIAMAACGQTTGGPAPISEPAAAGETAENLTPPPVTFVRGLSSELVLAQGIPLPIGIASDTHDSIGLMLFGRDGIVLGEMRTPPHAWLSKTSFHFAGSYDGSINLPLVFFQGEFEGDCQDCGLWIQLNEQASRLVEFRDMEALVGLPASPVIAYVERQFNNDSSALRSLLYAGDLDSLPTAQPVMVVDSTESRVLKPVAMRMDGESLTGIWYTQQPYGIGGEIVFEPTEGLYYLDLSTYTSHEVLPPSSQFSNLSLSQKWIAYSEYQEVSPRAITIRDLTSDQILTFQTLPESDRGAGSALISPDDYYVAWMEVRGSLMDGNYHSTIRIARTEGPLIADFPEESFFKAAGLGTEEIVIRPIGWLDEASILINISSPSANDQAVIVRINILTGEISNLAPGTFVGFVYP